MKPDFEILFEEPLNDGQPFTWPLSDDAWDVDPDAPTITIHLDNASGTFTPTGPRYEFGEERAT